MKRAAITLLLAALAFLCGGSQVNHGPSAAIAAGGGSTTATFDARFEDGNAAAASPFTIITGSANVAGSPGATSSSNLVLTVYLCFRGIATSGVSVTWDSTGTAQAMTQIGSKQTVSSTFDQYVFQRVAPTTGSHTISVSWTGGSGGIWVSGVTVYNAAQSLAGSINTATGTSTAPSLAVTSANNHLVIVGHVDNDATSTTVSTGTSVFVDTRFSGNAAGVRANSTTGSTTCALTLGTSVAWGLVGVDVANF